MKAKGIEIILSNDGRLCVKHYPYGDNYFVENNDGQDFQITKNQFFKFKETCNRKDESDTTWFRGVTTVWYYWRGK